MTTPDTAALRAISPTRLADEVALRLRAYIADNHLSVGDRLPSERQLASMLATSRATVSQALRTLSITGLIEVRQGSGAYLRADPGSSVGVTFQLAEPPTETSGPELAVLMRLVEGALTEGNRAPDFDVSAIRSAFARLEETTGSIAEFIEADAQFHLAVMRATDNRYLIAIFEETHRRIHSLTYSGWVRSGETPEWLEGPAFARQIELHRRIVEASAAADLELLRSALDDHHEAVLSHLDAGER